MAIFADPPEFFDDFLGYEPEKDPRYWKVKSGSGGHGWTSFGGSLPFLGTIGSNHARNGCTPLFTAGYYDNAQASSSAGMRLGQAGGDNSYDIRTWNPSSGLTMEASVHFSTNIDMRCSIGFVGFGDVPNLLEFSYEPVTPGQTTAWAVVINTGPDGTQPVPPGGNINTGFTHAPWAQVIFRLEISGALVNAFINDNLVGSYNGPATPVQMLVPEWVIWNKQKADGSWSKPWFAIDYLGIRQFARA